MNELMGAGGMHDTKHEAGRDNPVETLYEYLPEQERDEEPEAAHEEAGQDDAAFFSSEQGARAAVAAAIAAAGYGANGALFDPLLMVFAGSGDLSSVWTSERGDHYIAFLQFNGSRTDGFLPMGDYAVTTRGTIARTPVMLVKSSQQGVLAHPTGFTRIADDHGAHNANSIAYFWPIAPPGFQALGICVGINGGQPDPSHYWCVGTDYVAPSGAAPCWSDSGQRWERHDGSLKVPVAGDCNRLDRIVLAPTTLLSVKSGAGADKAYCLVLGKLFLPVCGGGAPVLDYDLSFGQGTSTAHGIEKVAVLPCSVVADPLTGSNAHNSPFYYLAAHPYWSCVTAFASPKGGTCARAYTIGTGRIESACFSAATSVTLGANAGVEAGGLGAPVSASYSVEMGLSGSCGIGVDTCITRTLPIDLPRAARVLVWQKQVEFVAYRTNGQALATARFHTGEIDFTDSYPA